MPERGCEVVFALFPPFSHPYLSPCNRRERTDPTKTLERKVGREFHSGLRNYPQVLSLYSGSLLYPGTVIRPVVRSGSGWVLTEEHL